MLAASESNLLAARELMAFTLGFHIVLASLGVALPAIILTAHYLGLRRGDEDAMRLARRWSKAMAVTFAVGAVTGTVLSFEFGLLWPRFMERFGDAFGIAFAVEGIFFFLEAIFIAVYIYGWKRLSGWAHFWSGVPMLVSGVGGAFSVVTANAWMNTPQGFTLDAAGKVVDTDPLEVLFSPAWTHEVPHMILAAYMVAGFLFASVYAVGMLRGRRDRHHRLGLLIPLTIACIATPVQIFWGDLAAREVADHQPAVHAHLLVSLHVAVKLQRHVAIRRHEARAPRARPRAPSRRPPRPPGPRSTSAPRGGRAPGRGRGRSHRRRARPAPRRPRRPARRRPRRSAAGRARARPGRAP